MNEEFVNKLNEEAENRINPEEAGAVSEPVNAEETANEPDAEAVRENASAEIADEKDASDEITNDSIPSVEAQPVEEPAKPQQASSYYGYNQSYGQNYSQPNAGGYGSYQQRNDGPTSYYYSQPQAQPVSPIPQKKDKKGLKVFAACIAVVLVFAMGFGFASLTKNTDKPSASTDSEKQNYDGPNVNINESPVTPTKVSTGGQLTPAQIHAKLAKSNVGIVVYTQNNNSSAGEGSGIIMGEDSTGTYTYIITCAHVISDAGVKVRIQTENGTTYDGEIVGFDSRTDLGVIRIKAKGLPAAEFGDSNALVVGDPVYAIGNPGGVEFFGTLTGGHISAIDRPVSSEIGYTMKCIQHDAAINPGNSGGMLVNSYGQVIGINSQKIAATDYEGMGFAIPITSAKEIIENLISHGYVPNRPKLGITYYPVSASAQYSMIAQIKGLPAGTLIINEINSDGSLANTEARQYDMIIAVDGKPLTTADVLLEKIDNGKVGDKLILTLCRVNSNYSIDEFEVEATLVEDKGGSEPVSTTQAYYIDPFEYFNQFGF